MRGGTFSYLFKQGIGSLFKNKLMTFASIGVLASCLFLISFATLLSVNVDSIIKYAEEQNEIVVFLDDLSEEDKRIADSEIRSTAGITDIKYVSKEDALKEQEEKYGALLEGLEDDNPLPDSYRIKVSAEFDLDRTVERLSSVEGVIQVNAPSNLAATLASIRKTAVLISVLIIILLILVTMVVIGNTIKLTVYARHVEINIMKQVGATDGFIRFPFLVEGGMLGFLSAVLCFITTALGYNAILKISTSGSASWMSAVSDNLVPFSSVGWLVLGISLVVGIATGIASTAFSVKKHLKI